MRKLYKSGILTAAIAAMAFIPLSSAQADSRHGVVDLLISNHGHHYDYYDHDYYDYFPHGLSYSLSYSKHRPWYRHHNHRHRHYGHHHRHKNKHHWKEHRGHRGHRNKQHHRKHRGHRD